MQALRGKNKIISFAMQYKPLEIAFIFIEILKKLIVLN
jgi:hypothetical protein